MSESVDGDCSRGKSMAVTSFHPCFVVANDLREELNVKQPEIIS